MRSDPRQVVHQVDERQRALESAVRVRAEVALELVHELVRELYVLLEAERRHVCEKRRAAAVEERTLGHEVRPAGRRALGHRLELRANVNDVAARCGRERSEQMAAGVRGPPSELSVPP